MSAFLEATRLAPLGPGRFSAQAEAGWRQGAGLWGGVVCAWFVRALEAQVGSSAGSSDRPLRSLTVDLCAPVKPRPAEVTARVVRAGRSASFCAAEVTQGGEVVATASAVFAARRSGDADLDRARAPEVAPPDALAPWPHGPPFPDFTRFLEHRQAQGPQPLSGGSDPRTGGWTRLLDPTPVDAALAVALLDAWPPALFGVLSGLRSAATVRATFDLLAPLEGLDPARPLLVTAHSALVRDGYSAEDEALWSPDGRLLAQGRQTVALL